MVVRLLVPILRRKIIQSRAFVIMGESRAYPGIHMARVHLLVMEPLGSAHALQRTRSIPTANPARDASDASFMRGRISATQKRLIGHKILEARTEIGPAKFCEYEESRRIPVAIF